MSRPNGPKPTDFGFGQRVRYIDEQRGLLDDGKVLAVLPRRVRVLFDSGLIRLVSAGNLRRPGK